MSRTSSPGDAGQQVVQRGQVVDVLQALAHRLQHDREVRVAASPRRAAGRRADAAATAVSGVRDRGGAAAVRARRTPGTGPRTAAESPSASVTSAFDVVGVEDEQVRARRRIVGVGQAHDDAVVGGGRGPVDALGVAVRSVGDRTGPRGVHPQSVRRMQDRPASRRARRGTVRPPGCGRWARVPVALRCSPISAIRLSRAVGDRSPFRGSADWRRPPPSMSHSPLAGELADRGTQFGGPADGVAEPERQPAGLAGGRDDQHAVVGDLGDRANWLRPARTRHRRATRRPSLRRARRRGAGSRSSPARKTPNRPRSGMVPPEVTASRRAPRPAGQSAGVAVADHAGPQLGELVGREPAGDQVEGGLEHVAAEVPVGGGAADGVEPLVDVESVDGARRRRSAGPAHRADWRGRAVVSIWPASMRCRGHGRVDEVGAVLGNRRCPG